MIDLVAPEATKTLGHEQVMHLCGHRPDPSLMLLQLAQL